jgi:hypothetical protein
MLPKAGLLNRKLIVLLGFGASQYLMDFPSPEAFCILELPSTKAAQDWITTMISYGYIYAYIYTLDI